MTSILAITNEGERQAFATAANHRAFWAYRPLDAASDPTVILEILAHVELRPATFVWIAAEAKAA